MVWETRDAFLRGHTHGLLFTAGPYLPSTGFILPPRRALFPGLSYTEDTGTASKAITLAMDTGAMHIVLLTSLSNTILALFS